MLELEILPIRSLDDLQAFKTLSPCDGSIDPTGDRILGFTGHAHASQHFLLDQPPNLMDVIGKLWTVLNVKGTRPDKSDRQDLFDCAWSCGKHNHTIRKVDSFFNLMCHE